MRTLVGCYLYAISLRISLRWKRRELCSSLPSLNLLTSGAHPCHHHQQAIRMRSARARLVRWPRRSESYSRSQHILSFHSQRQRRAHDVFGCAPFPRNVFDGCRTNRWRATVKGSYCAGTLHLYAFLVHVQMAEQRAGCSALCNDKSPWELGRSGCQEL